MRSNDRYTRTEPLASTRTWLDSVPAGGAARGVGDLPPSGQQLIALPLDDPPVPYAEISATLGIPGRQHRPQRRVLPENAAPSPSHRRSESTPAIAWREPTIRRLQARRTGRAGPRAKIPACLSRCRPGVDAVPATTDMRRLPSLRCISPSMPPVIEDGARVASHTQKISATLRVRRSPAGRSRILSSWTGSLGPRAWIHDHGDRQKLASDLQICRAAYRNRTDDLRITSASL